MKRRVGRFALFSFMALMLFTLIFAGVFWWRISQGPLSLSFLNARVQSAINGNLSASGVSVRTGGLIVERDEESGRPTLRLEDVRFYDRQGRMLAHAPRASLGISVRALFRGALRVRQLRLVGPRLILRRTAEGGLEMGFSRLASEKQDAGPAAPGGKDGEGDFLFGSADVFRFIDKQIFAPAKGRTRLSSLDEIYISRASISFYDELNDILWFAPRARLVFSRMPYGYALFIAANVSNGGRPWRTEMNATFRRKKRTFTVAARVFDVIPAEFARNIFALSKLAQMNLPLSGHVEAEFSTDGEMLKASAELTAGAGKVGFPGYIARPVDVQEGLIRVDYDPKTKDYIISPSTVRMNGGATELRGRVSPVRDGNGRVRALRIGLEIARGDLSRPRRKGEMIIDHLRFRGIARVDAAQLQVDELQIRAGGGNIRMHGHFDGEREGVGVYLGGLASNLSLRVVKKLWPPVLAPRTRQWIRANVKAGVVREGSFRIGVPAAAMLAAIRRHVPLPEKMVDVRFIVEGAKFRYFDGLPPISGAAGSARMTGGRFRLVLDRGGAVLPSGRRLRLERGEMKLRKLAAKVSPTTIEVIAAGRARAFAELLDMKPLSLLSSAGFPQDKLRGEARVRMVFGLPLSRYMKPSAITVSGSAEVRKAVIRKMAGGQDVASDRLRLAYGEGKLSASGVIRLGGRPAKMRWSRPLGKTAAGELELSMTVTDKDRRKFGFDLSPWLKGPTPLALKARLKEGRIASVSARADLSKVTMRIPPLKWSRPPVKGTKAAFDADVSAGGKIRIRRLDLRGKGVRIAGGLLLNADGTLREATLKRLELDGLTRLAVGIKNAKGRLEIAAAGDSFDARPFIRGFFSGRSAPPAEPGREQGQSPPPRLANVAVNLRKVIVEGGENIFEVRGEIRLRGERVERASLSGVLSSGRPVTLDVGPAAAGLRRLRILSRDAGALLRSSGLYNKVHGGALDFSALIGPAGGVRRGLLVLRRFKVRNERKLSDIAAGKTAARGPRRGLKFDKLTLPFSTDERFIRIGNALVRGDEIGASANGLIRKADGAMDIGGTIIPAYALNSAISNVPLLGDLLTGGKGQGVFGLNFALRGTMSRPKLIINPASAIAPGVLRNFFVVGGHNVNPDGTPLRRKSPRKKTSTSNVVGGR